MPYLEEHHIDLAFVHETWIRKSDNHLLKEIEEYGFLAKLQRKPRRLDLGGGVAVIHKKSLKIQEIKMKKYRSFECITCKLITENGPVLFSNIYRPDYSEKNRYTVKKFNAEFSSYLEEVSIHAIPTVFVGDYNLHIETLSNSYRCSNLTQHEVKKKREANAFNCILQNNDLEQLIDVPTHDIGGTLDLLIIQNEGIKINFWEVIDQGIVCESDHFPIIFTIKGRPLVSENKFTFTYQDFTSLNKQLFVKEFADTNILSNAESMNVTDMVLKLNNDLATIIHKQCPTQTKTVIKRSTSAKQWYTDSLRDLKCEKRRSERAWLNCKCFTHREQYDKLLRKYKVACDVERRKHFTKSIDDCQDDAKALHKTVKNLMGDTESSILPSAKSNKDLADQFGNFYSDKIVKLRKEIDETRSITTNDIIYTNDICKENLNSTLSEFCFTSQEDTRKLIRSLNNKHHPDDPIPVWLLKEKEDVFIPVIQSMINKSLIHEAIFPATLKHGTVRPIFKPQKDDTEIHNNYRPVTNTPFLSKLIEKAASNQITSYLEQNNMFPSHQSAYRKQHSCETVMVKIVDDIQQSLSEKKMVMLVLLDMSSAFDTVDQDILLYKLEHHFGISANVLQWLRSYLKGRTFSVRIQNVNGKAYLLIYGVPQGTILGPLLFVLYIHDIVLIGEKYGVSVELYADDSSWYYSFSPLSERSLAIENINKCMCEIKSWMELNYLKVNFDKTETLFLSNPLYHSVFYDKIFCTIQGEDFANDKIQSAKSLGVYLDNNITMNRMVNECVKTCYFNLKKLGGVRRLLSQDVKLKLVMSYVISRLDFCNALYANISKTLLNKLQKLLNACIRFVFNLQNRMDVHECCKVLHLLPVKYHIMFKLLVGFQDNVWICSRLN